MLEPGWITDRQIEASRVAMTRFVKRGGKIWIRLFPDKPVTKKPAETRMGKGKGAPDHWVAVVRPGKILFEMEGVTLDGRSGGHAAGVAQAASAHRVREAGVGGALGSCDTQKTRETEFMKAEKVRNLTDDELRHQERELNDQLFKLKFQLNMGQTESLKKIRGLRKDIARVKTIARERETGRGAKRRRSNGRNLQPQPGRRDAARKSWARWSRTACTRPLWSKSCARSRIPSTSAWSRRTRSFTPTTRRTKPTSAMWCGSKRPARFPS